MSEAETMYLLGYGSCSCHTCAPCSFCMALTEEEAGSMWNGGREGLHKYWRDSKIEKIVDGKEKALTELEKWVTIYDYERCTR